MSNVRRMLTAYRLAPDSYLDFIRTDSARFADLLGAADPAARVDSCPEWNASDLLWHLTEVQWFWSTLVTDRPQDYSVTEGRRPSRPEDHAELTAMFRRTSEGLVDALGSAGDDEVAWTWAPEQTVGFIRRRQAHEALIHRVDAELVAGTPSDLDPALATDGVDEALQVMFGGIPEWATFEAEHGPVEVRTSDTGGRWLVDVGRQSGLHPGSGQHVDEPTLDVRPTTGTGGASATAVAAVAAAAPTLDCWLWGRAAQASLDTSGDPAALAAFAAVIRTGVE